MFNLKEEQHLTFFRPKNSERVFTKPAIPYYGWYWEVDPQDPVEVEILGEPLDDCATYYWVKLKYGTEGFIAHRHNLKNFYEESL